MVTFRKNKQGEWVVFGPVSEVCVGKVLATRKSGQKRSVNVTGLGRPFMANGVSCVYGYIDGSRPPAEDRPAPVATIDHEVEQEREVEMDGEMMAEREMALAEAGFGRSYDAADCY